MKTSSVVTAFIIGLALGAGIVYAIMSKSVDCCDGYTLTKEDLDPSANRLVKQHHFMPGSKIEEWSNRYKSQVNDIQRDGGISKLFVDTSTSFNSCIIKSILCSDSSIGLRVMPGISDDGQVHIMLVGIDKDYRNLYIGGEEISCEEVGNSERGGAEMGMMP
jgi:hypothetical protein